LPPLLARTRLRFKLPSEAVRMFFFEKQNQENFCWSGPSLSGDAEAETIKFFLLLFSKKKAFLLDG
jgi:hypothetical protein